MARGKNTCKILKEIRRQIAVANDIEFVTSECRFKGDCLGTCPKCEAEVRYLEQQLRNRQLMGKAVVLAGLSAGMLSLAGCGGAASSTRQSDDSIDSDEPTERTLGYVESVDDECLEGDVDVAEEGDSVKIETAPVEIQSRAVKAAKLDLPSDSIAVVDLTGYDATKCVVVGEVVDPDEKEEARRGMPVDEAAKFPFGHDSLYRFMSQAMVYPKEAVEQKIEGKVIISFWVKENGAISEIEILRSPHPLLTNEAVRVIKTFPRFVPAKYKGVAVESNVILPITFRLPGETKKD